MAAVSSRREVNLIRLLIPVFLRGFTPAAFSMRQDPLLPDPIRCFSSVDDVNVAADPWMSRRAPPEIGRTCPAVLHSETDTALL